MVEYVADITDPIESILDVIQPNITLGYAIVGALLGENCDIYRPTNAMNPMDQINHIGVLRIMFDNDSKFQMRKPRQYKDTQMYASIDRTDTQLGDYIQDQSTNQIYFINSQEDINPTGVIFCNNLLSFYRPTAEGPSGYISNGFSDTNLNTYGSNINNIGNLLASNWPVSYLVGTKGEKELVALPNQSRSPWYIVKLPSIPGIRLMSNDLVVDQNDTRYLISSIEQTEHGYNITIEEVMV